MAFATHADMHRIPSIRGQRAHLCNCGVTGFAQTPFAPRPKVPGHVCGRFGPPGGRASSFPTVRPVTVLWLLRRLWGGSNWRPLVHLATEGVTQPPIIPRSKTFWKGGPPDLSRASRVTHGCVLHLTFFVCACGGGLQHLEMFYRPLPLTRAGAVV